MKTPEEYYNDVYGAQDDLGLPRTRRTYFDSLCHEYGCYDAERKMLDIGYLTMHGYDIRKDVHESFGEPNYPHVSERNVQKGVNGIEAAACGVDLYHSPIRHRNNSLDTDIDLMIEEVMRRYRMPLRSEKRHYIQRNPKGDSREEICELNGWDDIPTDWEHFYLEEYRTTYPGDDYLLRRHNLAVFNHETGNVTNTFNTCVKPEPWYGNPLEAQVIILGDMPIYDHFVNRSANLMLFPGYAEQFFADFLYRWWSFRPETPLYDENALNGVDSLHGTVNYMDLYNSNLYRHWINEFTRLANEEDIPRQQIFDRVAIINANPYYSDGNYPLAAGLLPSHYFLRNLIRFIANNKPNTIFIVPSKDLVKTWKIILADAWTDMWVSSNVIESERHNYQRMLTPRALGQKYFDLLIPALQKNNISNSITQTIMAPNNTISAKTLQELLAGRCQEFDSTKAIKLVRHADKRKNKMINGTLCCKSLADLYRNDRAKFLAYQGEQPKGKFEKTDFIVAFLGEEGTSARFIGVFRVDDIKPHPTDPKQVLVEYTEMPEFADLSTKVVIEWGPCCRNWAQNYYPKEKAILRIDNGF